MRYTLYITSLVWYLLLANTTFAYTHADTLRGSNGRGRDWWDVTYYGLTVRLDTGTKSVTGDNTIKFRITAEPGDSMQIDLQDPMTLLSAAFTKGTENYYDIKHVKEGNAWWLKVPSGKFKKGDSVNLILSFKGKPPVAKNPPWDGGFTWTHDSNGKPWIAVSCQGLGASVWWPCKDAQWDEPDSGMDIRIVINDSLKCISNGRPDKPNYYYISGIYDGVNGSKMSPEELFSDWKWHVKNPINNYDVTFYIGDYVHWHDTLSGEKGTLNLDYWVLRENEAKARKQFTEVKPMLRCFEYWMGPYPFYEDGYKLVDAPYLGMEHQSAVAYGNKYQMGYLGYDRSGTDIGMSFDYIIVHESGHEWFGNNITAKDIADNWIHESFTTYTETLYTECLLDKYRAEKYCRGEWKNITNDKPIIGDYGVNTEGSNDMYDKGTAILYMLRHIVNDDKKFREILRGLNTTFYHRTVTTQDVENYINKTSGIDFTPFFNQYLRTADIPELEYYIKDDTLYYKFNKAVPGFTLPLEIAAGRKKTMLKPTAEWQHINWKYGYNISVSQDFLVTLKA